MSGHGAGSLGGSHPGISRAQTWRTRKQLVLSGALCPPRRCSRLRRTAEAWGCRSPAWSPALRTSASPGSATSSRTPPAPRPLSCCTSRWSMPLPRSSQPQVRQPLLHSSLAALGPPQGSWPAEGEESLKVSLPTLPFWTWQCPGVCCRCPHPCRCPLFAKSLCCCPLS